MKEQENLRMDKSVGEGEITGHRHLCLADDVRVYGLSDERDVLAPTGTDVVHEEHKAIQLTPGRWDVYGQQEIDPDDEEARAVRD